MAKTGKRKTTNTGAVKTVDMTRGAGKTIRTAERGVIDNIWGVCLIAVGIFIFAAVRFNSAGTIGNGLGNILKGVFGQVGLILPFYLILFGILLLINKNMHISLLTGCLGGLIVLMMCLINSGRFIPKGGLPIDAKAFYATGETLESGGFFGMVIGSVVVKYLGKVGLYGIAIAVILVSALLIINIPVSQMLSIFGEKNRSRMDKQKAAREERRKALEAREKERAREEEIRRKEREKREKEYQRERNYIYKQGGAVEMSMAELLTKNGAQLFGNGRSSRDKVDSDDMIDFFNYTRDSAPQVRQDDRAQHFIDLLENNFSSSGGGKRKRSSTSQPSIVRNNRGLGANPYDDVSTGSSGFGMEGSSRRPSEPRTSESGPVVMDWTVDPFDDKPAKRKINTYETETEPKREEKPKTKPKVETTVIEPQVSAAAQALMDENTPEVSEKVRLKAEKEVIQPKEMVINKTVKKTGKYKKPPMDLLNVKDKSKDKKMSNSVLEEKAQELEDTLRSFNVPARVIGVTQGPTVTRYEVQPDIGVKVSRIVNLSDDIALNLRAKNIRIQAPIPGKAAIGIEVENDEVNMITFREMVESREFKEMNSKIAFVLGRDIAGKAIVADLAKMPHLLIAGATGSGKSVCVNGIIASFLYNATPDEVKLVLVDPKKVELGN